MVSDFTYVSTLAGFVRVALVIDVYARRIAGWKVFSCRLRFFGCLGENLERRHPWLTLGDC